MISPTQLPQQEESKTKKASRTDLEFERRLQRYEKAREWRRQSSTISGIARQLGIHRRSVRLYLQSEIAPGGCLQRSACEVWTSSNPTSNSAGMKAVIIWRSCIAKFVSKGSGVVKEP